MRLLTLPIVCALVLAASPAAAQRLSPSSTEGDASLRAVAAVVPEASRGVENAVVKVFATVRYPDPVRPWTKQAPQEVTGSGVIIEGRRILTNAHVVLYATQVQVQANQAGDKISATVEAVAPGIDLAVLELEDEAFFAAHPALACARTLPDVKDTVMAYGFPTGGTGLSITRGIVSRIEFAWYRFLAVSGLRIQIDAAINPGNSGGPAVVGDKMVGLAFAALGGAQNIGYIIPCEEIELFLNDVSGGRYRGKPAMFDILQTLESPALRSFLKLDRSVEGMVVHQPFRTDAAYPLKEWDVITRIGDTRVDDQGMIRVGPRLRVSFKYLVQTLAKDGKVPLTVVRRGKEIPILLPVSSEHPMLIPDLDGAYPRYFVYGPLVFSAATSDFMGALNAAAGTKNAFGSFAFLGSPLVKRLGEPPAFEGEELVVVSSPLLPHRSSKGYSSPAALVLRAVNGIPIKRLHHLVAVLRDCRDDYVTFEFALRGAESMVLVRKDVLAATDEILSDNGIRSQGSPDTLAVWNAVAAK